MTEAQILDLARYRESDAFSALEKAVLDYAVALSQTPANASDELVARLREELSDPQLVELTAAIAWENFRARFNRGFDVAAQGFSQGAVCPIPERTPSVRPASPSRPSGAAARNRSAGTARRAWDSARR